MTKPAQPIRLYGFPLSGHSHRVQLFLSLLQLPMEVIPVDLPNGAHKKPEFLAKNAFGQIPVIEDGDVTLADSTAILVYLARKYDAGGSWAPLEPLAAAEVQRWLSVASGALFNGPSTARLGLLFGRPVDVAKAQQTANALLEVLNAHLNGRQYLVGQAATIADLALYSYTVLAPEGGIQLDAYPNVLSWLARIEALPGFIAMPRSNVAKAS